ncbi:MAG: transposase [Roseinatronobacter sp.]
MPTIDSGHLEVGDGGEEGLKKRVWSEDEKRTICAQTLTPGVSVAQVARRYSMNANLIFKWLKDSRFTPVEGKHPARAVVTRP